ncbi:MAG: hypothetical protein AAF414_07805 [Pseudomonadota bacterium]
MAVRRQTGVWFEPRAGGKGIRPVNSKGWALVIAYLAALGIAIVAMPRPGIADPMEFAMPLIAILAVMAVATFVFVLLVRRHTAAGN